MVISCSKTAAHTAVSSFTKSETYRYKKRVGRSKITLVFFLGGAGLIRFESFSLFKRNHIVLIPTLKGYALKLTDFFLMEIVGDLLTVNLIVGSSLAEVILVHPVLFS